MKRALPSYGRQLTTGKFATSNSEANIRQWLPLSHYQWVNRRRQFSSLKESDSSTVLVTRTHEKSRGLASPYTLEKEELTQFVDELLLRTRSLMDNEKKGSAQVPKGKTAHHVIAFSGGIDSSVAAALIHKVATSYTSLFSSQIYDHEKVTAVLGLSPAVPIHQRQLAEEVAATIGFDLEQISTTEGTDEVYVANDGRACLACKTHLYDNLKSIAEQYCSAEQESTDTILYNGTNADDLKDPTRLGLIAANDFAVRSPLSGLPKERVRAVGKHLGLPNWDYAASPCLRSRLAVGVEATSDRLKNVDRAEAFVRDELGRDQPGGTWDVRKSLRVRILSKNRAMIEVDDDQILQTVQSHLEENPWNSYFEEELGFAAVGVRKFKTGSVAPPPPPNRIASIASPTGGAPRKLRRRP